MNSSDAEAVAATATALAPQEEIGHSASFHILQVMSPTLGTDLALDHGETMVPRLFDSSACELHGHHDAASLPARGASTSSRTRKNVDECSNPKSVTFKS